MHLRSSRFGLFLVVLSGILFGCSPTVSKQLQLRGMDPFSLCFFLQLSSFFLLFPYTRIRYRHLKILPKDIAQLTVVGITGMGATTLLLNLAYQQIPVGISTCIHFTYPSIVLVVMVLAFGERFTRRKLAAIFFSVCGMFFLVGTKGESGEPIGFVFALGSAFTFSFYLIANAKLQIRRLPVPLRLCYANLFSALALLIICLLRGGIAVCGDLLLLLLCLLLSIGGHILLNCGINQCGPALSAFASMSEPVTSTLLSILIFREGGGWIKLAGLVFIVLSIGATAQKDRNQDNRPAGGILHDHPLSDSSRDNRVQ